MEDETATRAGRVQAISETLSVDRERIAYWFGASEDELVRWIDGKDDEHFVELGVIAEMADMLLADLNRERIGPWAHGGKVPYLGGRSLIAALDVGADKVAVFDVLRFGLWHETAAGAVPGAID